MVSTFQDRGRLTRMWRWREVSRRIVADVRQKAKAVQRFRCEPCNYDAATQSALIVP